MLLKNKIAVIYGAGGSVGGAVARGFAREGAKIFLAGRSIGPLEDVAREIIASGGLAETAIVDALSENSVVNFIDTVIKKEGNIDICFNAIGIKDVQGTPIVDMLQEDFIQPVMIAMKTQFITSKTVAKQMIKNKSGVILSISATPAGKAYPLVGGFGPACSAIEAFSRNLASELGPEGVRVVCIRSAGSPDSAVFMEAIKRQGSLAKFSIDHLIKDTMLNKLPRLDEIANTAAFMVSDRASGITGTSVNVTCGTTRD